MSSPIVSRSEPWATSCTLPIASSTWLGSREPDVHALPEEAQIPLSSRRSRSDSPSMPSKQKFTLPGSRCTASPFRAECGISESPAIRRSLAALMRAAFSCILPAVSLSAAAIPTIEATFSVPARFPRSCAPPSIKLVRRTPLFAYKKPIPFGPWNLCAEEESMSILSSCTLIGTWPTACTASVWNSTPRLRQIAPISRMGWIVPISLFANMIVTRHVSSRIAFSTSSGRTRPSSWTSRSVTSKPSLSSLFSVWSTA